MSQNELLKAYGKHTEELPSAVQQTVASVLFNCLQAVTTATRPSSAKGAVDGLSPGHEVICGTTLVSLPTSGTNATFSSLVAATRKAARAASEIGNDSILLPANDSSSLYTAIGTITMMSQDDGKNHPSSTEYAHILMDLHDFEYRAMVRRAVPLILRNPKDTHGNTNSSSSVGFPLLVETSLTRSVNDAELRAFSKLTANELYCFNQMQQADEMCKSVCEPLPDFTKSQGTNSSGIGDSLVLNRRFYRQLSASTLAQIISSENLKEPKVLQKYYPATDELIYLLHWPPPNRRIERSDWSPLDVAHIPPGVDTAANSSVKTALPTAEKFQQDTIMLTPAGKAIIMVKQLYSTGAAWTTVHLDTDVFGLRQDDLVNFAKSRTWTPKRKGQTEEEDEVGEVEIEPEIEAEPEPEPTEDEDADREADEENDVEDEDAAGSEEEEGGVEAAPVEPEPDPEPAVEEEKTEPDIPPTSFVYEAEDRARVVIEAGPIPDIPKPDKFGTVLLTHTDVAGLSTTAWSNGTLRFHSTILGLLHPMGGDSCGDEISRVIGAQGTVTRRLINGPYSRDVMFRDGSRVLYNAATSSSRPSSSEEPKKIIGKLPKGFHSRLLTDAPTGWTYVRLKPDGTVRFYTNGTGKGHKENMGIPHATLTDLRNVSIDAETKSTVITYMDGRTQVSYMDGLLDVTFPDGTRFMTASDQVTYISKENMPIVELDIDIDTMCIGHSKGEQVSIAKGGLRVRFRCALNDGSALLIKYDTSITAECNGSIKFVKRDRTVIRALDTGEVTFTPKTAWDRVAEMEFKNEAMDTFVSSASVPASAPDIRSPPAFTTTSNSHAVIRNSTFDANKESNGSLLVHGGHNDRVNQSVTFQNENISVAEREGKENSSSTVLGDIQSSFDYTPCPYDDPLQTKYVFNIYTQSCSIQDYEFNRFDIDLGNPMNPIVDLAGEVEGLKPEAVTDKPLQPRVFIISRTADAIEIVADETIIDMQRIAWYNNDVEKLSGDSPHTGPKSGLESSLASTSAVNMINKHKSQRDTAATTNKAASFSSFYFRHRLGRYDDKYTFEEIFSKRIWKNRTTPAVASIDNKRANAIKNSKQKPPLSASIYRVFTFLEKSSLSPQEYNELTDGIQRWKQFRIDRLDSIDRFSVGDSRSILEQKEEEDIQTLLRIVYKDLRTAERKKAKLLRQESEASATVDASNEKSDVRITIADTNNDNDDDDNSSSVMRRKDSQQRALDMAERELRDAFESFAVESTIGQHSSSSISHASGNGSAGGSRPNITTGNDTVYLEYANIPSSLLQLFGVMVDNDMIDIALDELGIQPSNIHGHSKPDYSNAHLTMHEFRILHGTMGILIHLRAEEEEKKRVVNLQASLPIPPSNSINMKTGGKMDGKSKRGEGKNNGENESNMNRGSVEVKQGCDSTVEEGESVLMRVKTGPGRLQKSNEDSGVSAVSQIGGDNNSSGQVHQHQIEEHLYDDVGNISTSFVEGWSEIGDGAGSQIASSGSNVGGMGLGGALDTNSIERLSKTAPGKAQNVPRSWYEDEADQDGMGVGISVDAENGSSNNRGRGRKGVATGSVTEDISSSSHSVPQGSAIQVARANKKA